MTAISDFFHMGGYAVYVWCSFGVCFLTLIVNIVLPIRAETKTLKSISRLSETGYEVE